MSDSDSANQLKRAAQAIKDLRTRLETVERARKEPIAIVGLACRFSGGANSPEAFWQLLKNRTDAITPVPAERWDAEALFDADPTAIGKVATRWGGFLSRVDEFDAAFFGIAPREAMGMDPQQRLLLEVAWEAFEDAGQTGTQLAGSRTGVFVGVHSHSTDYYLMQATDPDDIDAYTGTGTSHSVTSGRLSYIFDLHGPNVAIDTACSSSLVAVHLACQSLRNGECNLALAGGVNLMLTPHFTVAASKMRMMAADGRCKTFDARADGFVRGEGCGAVVLKRLSEALADGDNILALIRGSAINQDGHTNGLTAPNGLSQQAVMRQALDNAGVKPEQITYIETHGTGTPLGDPIEVEALGAVVGQPRADGLPCVLGSVKTNLGHLEGAAGVAGLIKTVLALQHQTIPANLHFQQLNPHITLSGTRLALAAEERAWPAPAEGRYAGVSSFGWSGTNAHLILEEAPAPAVTSASERDVYLLPLSARSAESLKALAEAYRDLLQAGTAALPDVCYTASVRRSHHDYRLAVIGRSSDVISQNLTAHLNGEERAGIASGHAAGARPPGVVFVFPGQGSQWVGMGRQLLEREPVFREALEQCAQAFRPHVDWNLLDQLRAEGAPSRLDEIDVIQPMLFAMQVGLAAVWRARGVEPDAVVGHSLGEVAAAHVAGALTLDDAARVICTRSRLMKRASGKGAMAVVELSMAEAQAALAGYEDRLGVAVNNGPRSVVLSGDPDALEQVTAALQARNVFCRPVKVDVAAHSPHMEPFRAELVAALASIRPQATSVPMISTVTGEAIAGPALDAAYWGRNLREPVLFAAATQRLIESAHSLFIEISPHPVLLTAIEQTQQSQIKTVASLRRNEDEVATLLEALGQVYAAGYNVDWKRLYPAGQVLKLPAYVWRHERFWLEAPTHTGGASTSRMHGEKESHPLLGWRSDLAGGDHRVWQIELSQSKLPHVYAHQLLGSSLLGASTSIEMALAAAQVALPNHACVLSDLNFKRALVLPAGSARTLLQVTLKPAQMGGMTFGLYGRQASEWTLHVSAQLEARPNLVLSETTGEALDAIRGRCVRSMAGEDFYRGLESKNIQISKTLRGITQLWQGQNECLAQLAAPASEAYWMAPAALDAGFQLLGLIGDAAQAEIYMPTSARFVRSTGWPAHPVWAVMRWQSAEAITADIEWRDESGQIVAEVQGLHLQLVGQAGRPTENLDDWLYELSWRPTARSKATHREPATTGDWLILADKTGVGEALAALLNQQGHHCVVASIGSTFSRIGESHFVVRPDNADDLRYVLREASQRQAFRGIVHLWSLEAPSPETLTAASLEAAQVFGCGTTVTLVHELARVEWPHMPRLWLITRGAQATGQPAEPPVHFAQAPLWGLGRVVAEEHREVWGGLIDLDPAASLDEAAHQLCEEFLQSDGEDQLAYRGQQRLAARLTRLTVQPTRPMLWRADAAYLITGGLGGIGLHVARWMAAQGARRLILMGRTPLPARTAWNQLSDQRLKQLTQAIRELETLGVSVHYAAVDVGDEAQLKAFVEDYQREGWPPIRGVIHAAGVIEDRMVLQMDADALRTVMRPKVIGGWLLHHVLRNQPLEWFVLFSSVGALFGQPGQGNYAAANAFLDALAHYRRAQQQPAQSLNWGAWSGLGFANTPGGQRVIQRLEAQGITRFSVARGLEALERLAKTAVTQVAVMPVNWEQFRASNTNASRLTAELEKAAPAATTPAQTSVSIREAMLALKPDQRRAFLETHLQTTLAQVLRLPLARIEPHTPLGALGLESLMAIEFRNRLEASLGVTLSATLVWNYPTVHELATFIAKKLGLALDAEEQIELRIADSLAPEMTGRQHVDHVHAMTDEEALRALLRPKEKR